MPLTAFFDNGSDTKNMQVTKHVQHQYETHLPPRNSLKKEKAAEQRAKRKKLISQNWCILHWCFGHAAAWVQLHRATAQAVYSSHSSACSHTEQLSLKPECYYFAKTPLPSTNCFVLCTPGHYQGRRVPPSSQVGLCSSCCSWIHGVCWYTGLELPPVLTMFSRSEIYLQVLFLLKRFLLSSLNPTHFVLGSFLFSHKHSGDIKACRPSDSLLSFWEQCYLFYFFAHLLLEVLAGIWEVTYQFSEYAICLQATYRIRNRPVISPEQWVPQAMRFRGKYYSRNMGQF